MAYSMTGFGRHEVENNNYKVTIEIKSVNHRYNDITIKMTRKLTRFEENMKQIIRSCINRGRVEVFVNFEETEAENVVISPNFVVLDEYVSALNMIKETYNVKDDIGISLLSRFPDALKIEAKEADEDEIWGLLEVALKEAIKNLIDMRMLEGEKLKEDIISRVQLISDILTNIENLAPSIVQSHKIKMQERLKDLLSDDIEIDEQRIALEVAIFTDKTNITEEIVRLKSHFKQLLDILKDSNPIGRKLDFLIQEMNREINTIGSKSPDVDISSYVVDMKSEIEKIREQVQNIE